jgi:myo-inositol-1(or 4)-monophosphatase
MNITNLKTIGKRLLNELPPLLYELRKEESLGKGAGGDRTHPIDKMAEDIIIEEAEGLNEPLTIISEEFGFKEINGGGPKLLIDPVDGSRNAISGVPLFSTSIALVDGATVGETAIGYILNLASSDEYWAIKGGGSFLNGKMVRTQEDDSLKVIAYEAQTLKVDIPKIAPLLSLYNRARCFGSTALDLALLAQGALSTLIIPYPSRSFDFAAGYILLNEAGGVITDLNGNDIDDKPVGVEKCTPLLASANEELHKKALEVIKTVKQ